MSSPAFQYAMNVLVSLAPLFIFLAALIFLDSYKLIKLRDVILTILIGCIVSYAAFWVNTFAFETLRIPTQTYKRYGAPLVEEIFKAAYIVYLMRSQRIGFMVDAAIYGFAVGAGFAFIENIYYLQSV